MNEINKILQAEKEATERIENAENVAVRAREELVALHEMRLATHAKETEEKRRALLEAEKVHLKKLYKEEIAKGLRQVATLKERALRMQKGVIAHILKEL